MVAPPASSRFHWILSLLLALNLPCHDAVTGISIPPALAILQIINPRHNHLSLAALPPGGPSILPLCTSIFFAQGILITDFLHSCVYM